MSYLLQKLKVNFRTTNDKIWRGVFQIHRHYLTGYCLND